jgi:hypothetical protein
LQSVTLRHQAEYAAEAACLLGWIKKGLARGGAELAPVAFTVKPEQCQGCFELNFGYADPKKIFLWQADLAKNHAEFTGDLGHGRTNLTVGAHLLSPEMALAEAMFF